MSIDVSRAANVGIGAERFECAHCDLHVSSARHKSQLRFEAFRTLGALSAASVEYRCKAR
jgi:hypothetical protein